jgi:hypothetical protein
MFNVLRFFTKYFLSLTDSREQTGAVVMYNIHQLNLHLFQATLLCQHAIHGDLYYSVK